jgi:hypothetical protein
VTDAANEGDVTLLRATWFSGKHFKLATQTIRMDRMFGMLSARPDWASSSSWS